MSPANAEAKKTVMPLVLRPMGAEVAVVEEVMEAAAAASFPAYSTPEATNELW